jgi:hypothetical protein
MVEETAGEFASPVFSRPWTIHGCRPISVSIHPAVIATKGRNDVKTASQRNHLNRSSRRFQSKNAPTSATSAMRLPA